MVRDIVIVGAGVAGLSAGLIAAQSGFDTVVVDPLGGGGQLVNIDRVLNYPGLDEIHGFDLGPRIATQAMDQGVSFVLGTVDGLRAEADELDVVLDSGDVITGKSVILAMGSSIRRAGIENEEAFEGRGISYCGVCDGPFFAGREIAVVGGGDSAADEALYLATLAKRVHLVFPAGEMHAMAAAQKRLRELNNVVLMPNYRVAQAAGDGSGLKRLQLVDVRDSSTADLEVEGAFLYTGLASSTAFLKGLMELDEGGHVVTDACLRTNVPGIFAAGDIRQFSVKLLAAAAGDGASAAVWAGRYLRGQRSS